MMNMNFPGMAGAPQRKVRKKVLPERITGRLTDWKGKFGWIQPDMPINHPEAAMNRGKIYLGERDIEASIGDTPGTHVSFFVYADGSGLGAMNCRPSSSEAAAPSISKPTVMGPGGPGKPMGPGPGFGGPVPRPAAQPPKAAAPPAPLPTPPVRGGKRERLSDEPVKGSVKMWKGSFGWIKTEEDIKHPLFKGDIYVTAKDVEGAEMMGVGMDVYFFVYADAQGLGAENVTVVAPETIEVMPKRPKAGASIPGLGGDSGFLKAKPKAKTSIPTGLDAEIASRLNAWMWDQGG
jgi:hypothetical protein